MVYTKKGDDGTTSLVGGRRVKKCDLRVEAYGTVDELNAHVGLLAAMVGNKREDTNVDYDIRERFEPIVGQLKRVQNSLFVVQTLLATEDAATYAQLPQLPPAVVDEMEGWIDTIDDQLPKLKSFVMPGGSVLSAQAHVARTVCRRAEREMVRLAGETTVEEVLCKYINRLSDYLFVISRYLLLAEHRDEKYWSAV